MVTLLKVLYKNRLALVFILILGITALIVSSYITYYAIQYNDFLRKMEWYYWVLFFAITCFSMGLALTPTTFIATVSGYFLSWKAIPGLIIGYITACLIGYYLGRFFDKGKLLSTLSKEKKIQKWLEKLRYNQIKFVILSRLSPVLPFALMNVVLAALAYDKKKFIIGSFIGMLPRTLLFIWIGAQAHHFVEVVRGDEQFGIQEISVIFLTVLTFFGFYWYLRK